MPADGILAGQFGASFADEVEDRIDGFLADGNAADQGLRGDQFVGGEHRAGAILPGAGGGEQHGPLGLAIGVADVDLEQEAIELGFRKGVGAFLLERVLGREHVERAGQGVFDAADGDLTLLHGLQKGGLGARAGAVDLVGHQELAEHRAGHEAEAAAAGAVIVEDFGAGDVGGHQVGGELHPGGMQAEDGAECVDQQGLAEAGHADEQAVAAREDGDEHLLDHVGLAEDDAGDLGLGGGEAATEFLDIADEASHCVTHVAASLIKRIPIEKQRR